MKFLLYVIIKGMETFLVFRLIIKKILKFSLRLSQLNPDIIHIQFEPGLYGLSFDNKNPRNSMTYLDLFYKKNKNIPIVTTFHSGYKLTQWLSAASLIKKEGRIGTLGIPLRLVILFWKSLLTYVGLMDLLKEKLQSINAGIML